MGQYAAGLAFRKSSGTIFTVKRGGAFPYELVELTLPDPSPTLDKAKTAEMVKDWGKLGGPKPLLPGKDWQIATMAGLLSPIPDKGDRYVTFRPSYEDNYIVPPEKGYTSADNIFASVSVETKGKEGYVSIGDIVSNLSYHWYGNGGAHADPTKEGEHYHNNLDSKIFSGKKVLGLEGLRGNHAEKRDPIVYITDPAALRAVAQKIKDGTVTDKDLQIPPSSITNVADLGGSVPMGHATGKEPSIFQVTGLYWDKGSSTLYALVNGAAGEKGAPEPAVYEWTVDP